MPLKPLGTESRLNPGLEFVHDPFSYLPPATDFPAVPRLTGKRVLQNVRIKGGNEMNRTYRSLSVVRTAMAATALALASPVIWADDDDDDDEIPYDEAELFFELNNTDGDLGIHALIDGEGWKRLTITDKRERKMLSIRVKGRLQRQGLTEIFFESAEPRFADLPPAVFFDRFPEGEYEIEGRTLDGSELESEVELTHTMPAPAAPEVNGEAMAVQCDDDEDFYDASEVTAPVTIEWPDVTMSHPDAMGGGAGVQPRIPVTINNYQVVLEVEAENPDDEEDPFDAIFSIELPPWETSVTIPEEFTDLGDTFKYEVLAREESFNQTAVESCFVLVD